MVRKLSVVVPCGLVSLNTKGAFAGLATVSSTQVTFCFAALAAWKSLSTLLAGFLAFLIRVAMLVADRVPSLVITVQNIIDWLREVTAPEDSPALRRDQDLGKPELYRGRRRASSLIKDREIRRRRILTPLLIAYEVAFIPYVVLYWFFV